MMKLLRKATGLTIALIALVTVLTTTGPADTGSAGAETHASASAPGPAKAPDPGWD
ncbi:hypothetical protein Snoj_71680 [Streptomyces nojiriensis]|uniref:Uncharacterized protein n=1 Tax=Streptomyces nojiriensis TaxID=66374 RepID=A0ABQ3SYP1_9ACTN|nr:hypothetical protein GCM10010205_32550 [Streptomyces nojiriensis]GHI73250.1 hypothetical protein Snoj_71680 [Streptomyces nojiriensis]